MENNIIEVRNVTKVLGGRAVLSNLNFQVPKGSIYGILGPNGSGKTTLLRILLGLFMPESGEVTVLGQNPSSMTREGKNWISFVLEDHGLNERLTAFQNIDFFAQVYGVAKEKRRARILDLLDKVELSSYVKKPVGTFSKGMKQRLSLARALIHDPKILFLDEPTSNLDPEGTVYIRNLILRLSRYEGITIYINSHDLDEVQRICTQIAIMKSGSIMVQGAMADLLRPNHLTTLQVKLEESVDFPELANLLSSLSFVTHFTIEKDVAMIELVDDSSRLTLFNSLAQNAIPVKEITQIKNSLEDLYISIVREEDHHGGK
ncbi:MAG: ABC transporter ATP-binding protein [Anaerolineaceae bacterium]|nr:ABC transporter ATP-binding protein [Anaerolineaceae bacterium]